MFADFRLDETQILMSDGVVDAGDHADDGERIARDVGHNLMCLGKGRRCSRRVID